MFLVNFLMTNLCKKNLKNHWLDPDPRSTEKVSLWETFTFFAL